MAVEDILAKLEGPSWRGVPFPYSELSNELTQDHAEHKLPDVDGAHVEATGRNNLQLSATIPFCNGVMAAPSEKWYGRVLYPDLFRSFVAAMAQRFSGDFIHPELGRLNCKPKSCSWKYAPQPRDGVIMQAAWTESTDTGEDLNAILAQPSSVATAALVAVNLDAEIAFAAQESAYIKSLNESQSFGDIFQTIQSIPDSMTLYSQQIGGSLHNIAAKIDRMSAAFSRLNHVRWYPITQGLEHLKSSVRDIQTAGSVTPRKKLVEYRVVRDTTLPALAILLGQTVDELARINPELTYRPIVRARKVVRYFVLVA